MDVRSRLLVQHKHAVARVKHLLHQQLKELLLQPPCIRPLLPRKHDPQRLQQLQRPLPRDFPNGILQHTVPPDHQQSAVGWHNWHLRGGGPSPRLVPLGRGEGGGDSAVASEDVLHGLQHLYLGFNVEQGALGLVGQAVGIHAEGEQVACTAAGVHPALPIVPIRAKIHRAFVDRIDVKRFLLEGASAAA